MPERSRKQARVHLTPFLPFAPACRIMIKRENGCVLRTAGEKTSEVVLNTRRLGLPVLISIVIVNFSPVVSTGLDTGGVALKDCPDLFLSDNVFWSFWVKLLAPDGASRKELALYINAAASRQSNRQQKEV